MSSLVRRLQIRMMQRVGYTREKWIVVQKPGRAPETVNVKRGGEITDRDDNPVGRLWPRFLPKGAA